jgi:phosphonate transport system substrate-binding protein
VQTAFTTLDSKGQTDILDQQAVDQYVGVSHDAFTSLETAVEMAGIERGGDG